MRSVFYIEEDFVAGLLRNYFAGSRKSTQFLGRGANGQIADALRRDSIDFFLAQSEDAGSLTKVLQTVQRDGGKVPTLVLHGREDSVIPFEVGRRMAAAIPGARFVPLQSKNHLLLETEPAWPMFLSAVGEFLGMPQRTTPQPAASTCTTALPRVP